MFIKRLRLITIRNANVSTCDYWGDEFKLAIEMAEALLFLSFKYELLSQYKMPNAHIGVMSLNDALDSVLFDDLDTFNTRNACIHSMALPSMSNPFLLSAHSLLSACFLLSTYFPAVHSYKRMRLTTSVYGMQNTALFMERMFDQVFNLTYLYRSLHLLQILCDIHNCVHHVNFYI